MKTKKVIRKALNIKESGRSTDFISPSFINECGLNCLYCYVKRHQANNITVAKNVGDLLTSVNNHVMWLGRKVPNQTHEKYWSYDIGCNSDIGFHQKQFDWKYVFEFFKNHDNAMASFATKVVPKSFLSFDPNEKIRIRFSLMPQRLSSIIDPKTSLIEDRLKAVDDFKKAGYEVHLNFSPVVVYSEWKQDYKELFEMVDNYIEDKRNVKSEVIFLTHNVQKHLDNLNNNRKGEEFLWCPEIQEDKKSQYGGQNIRYERTLKSKWISEFKELHNSVIPFNTIRYIF